jgi:hypothetical protein
MPEHNMKFMSYKHIPPYLFSLVVSTYIHGEPSWIIRTIHYTKYCFHRHMVFYVTMVTIITPLGMIKFTRIVFRTYDSIMKYLPSLVSSTSSHLCNGFLLRMKNQSISDSNCNIVHYYAHKTPQGMPNISRFTFSAGDTKWVVYN